MSGDPSLRWLEVRARPGPSVAGAEPDPDLDALLADGLLGLGGRAIEERDGWWVTYLDRPSPEDAREDRIAARLSEDTGLHGIEVSLRWQPDEEWAETWKRGLAPRRITPRLVVTPSWMDAGAGPGDIVVVVDPKMAFGTAEHGTTRGCLRLLDGVVEPGSVWADIGSGSGILSIAAARMGAARVTSVEGDPLACEAQEENLEANGVDPVVTLMCAWADDALLEGLAPLDGLVANIETGILRPMLAGFRAALRPGGVLILSGIMDVEWPTMEAAVAAAGFTLDALDEDGEWRAALLHS
ncbi:MAG: 50S ribosomal protein L11 methyltransferase [Gemmatimonadota bacterium]|nr:50S ribosomal protein L11 methyltransferase [Gemmatimonadota bacterium]